MVPAGRWSRRLRQALAAPLVLAMLLAGSLLAPEPSHAALDPLGWAVSNTTTGLTGTTHAFTFVKTGGNQNNIRCVRITTTMPGGFGGTPTGGIAYGVPPLTSVTISGGELTFLFSANAQIRDSAVYYFEVGGITNTSVPGNYTVTATLRGQVTCGTTPGNQSGTSDPVHFASTGMDTTVQVAAATAVSITRNDVGIGLDPGSNDGAGIQEVTIGITSNAAGGYVLTCAIAAQPSGFTARTSGAATAGPWVAGGASQFGYALSVTNNGGHGSPAPAGSLSASNFAGFVTGPGETCGTASGRTGNPLPSDEDGCGSGLCGSAAHAWHLVLKAVADNDTPTGTATATITLSVTPTY